MSAVPSPSPRPSISLRSPSSSRTSLDLPGSAQNSLTRPARRNRAALRDYYNIKSAGVADGIEPQTLPSPSGTSAEQSALAELDKDGFDAGNYVRRLLERENLEGLLKVENELVAEIRGLDGDRKALVYDNYSKLISATDTIRKMRTNMDPLAPTTSTLAPAISGITETATALSRDLAAHAPAQKSDRGLRQSKERQTVQWVLYTPQRLEQLILNGKVDQARDEWRIAQDLLEKWAGVEGVDEISSSCEKILGGLEP